MITRLQVPLQTPPHHSSRPNSNLNPNSNPNSNSKRNHNLLKPINPLKTQSSSSPPPISNPGSNSGLLFRQKLLYLQNLDINTTKVLEKNPNIRSSSLQSIKSIEHCLLDMGIEQSDMRRVFEMYPQLLTCDVNNDLHPVFQFLLNDVNIPFSDIRRAVIRCPRLLICDVDDQLRPTLSFLRGLGFVGANAVTSQTTMLLVSNVEGTLIPKIDYLRGLGFSYKEAVTMVLRSPGLLTFSIANNFEPKVEYFLKEMRGDLLEIKKFPQYFSFSLERIKRRHRLLVEHGFWLPLSEMLKVSEGKFESRLVEMRLQSVDKKLLM